MQRDRLTAAAKRSTYCKHCGGSSVHLAIPPGDQEHRYICQACGAIEYVNPKLGGQILQLNLATYRSRVNTGCKAKGSLALVTCCLAG